MRFFLDPNEELFRELRIRQFKGKKCLENASLNRENAKNPDWAAFVQSQKPEWKEQGLTQLPEGNIAAYAKEINSWKSGLDLKYRVMVYAKLYSSTKEDQYWKADTVYAVIGKSKLKSALLSMLESLASDSPEYIVQMLNPTVAGGWVTVTVTGGTQGTVTITPIPGSAKDPIIELKDGKGPDWWRPLDEVFVKKEFNLKAWEDVEAEAEKIIKEHREKKVQGGTTSSEGSSDGEPSDSEDESRRESTSSPVSSDPVKEDDTPPFDVDDKKIDETPKEETLPEGQVKTKMGRIVTLPDFAIADKCFTTYNPGNPKCITCPVNLECMTERV
jgi:hypothetical protein